MKTNSISRPIYFFGTFFVFITIGLLLPTIQIFQSDDYFFSMSGCILIASALICLFTFLVTPVDAEYIYSPIVKFFIAICSIISISSLFFCGLTLLVFSNVEKQISHADILRGVIIVSVLTFIVSTYLFFNFLTKFKVEENKFVRLNDRIYLENETYRIYPFSRYDFQALPTKVSINKKAFPIVCKDGEIIVELKTYLEINAKEIDLSRNTIFDISIYFDQIRNNILSVILSTASNMKIKDFLNTKHLSMSVNTTTIPYQWNGIVTYIITPARINSLLSQSGRLLFPA